MEEHGLEYMPMPPDHFLRMFVYERSFASQLF